MRTPGQLQVPRGSGALFSVEVTENGVRELISRSPYDDENANDDAHYLKACWNACDAIGATTEALEAGVLRSLLELVERQVEAMCDTPMSDMNYAGIAWASDARAVLAKLGAKEGE